MKFHGSGNVSSNILTMDAHGYSAGLHVPKLIGYIEHPKKISPDARLPASCVTPAPWRSLITYLVYQRTSGTFRAMPMTERH